MKPVSIRQPLKHYTWGQDCEGWNLAETDSLSVKQERMPAGAAEILHMHQQAHQFFFILAGQAQFEVEDVQLRVKQGEGLYIEAGKKHRILNPGPGPLDFILCSGPSAQNDRMNQ